MNAREHTEDGGLGAQSQEEGSRSEGNCALRVGKTEPQVSALVNLEHLHRENSSAG